MIEQEKEENQVDGELWVFLWFQKVSSEVFSPLEVSNLRNNYSYRREDKLATLPKFKTTNNKYTIGVKYTNREEQGEFIFLSYDRRITGNIMEILGTKDGAYWITPIEVDLDIYL